MNNENNDSQSFGGSSNNSDSSLYDLGNNENDSEVLQRLDTLIEYNDKQYTMMAQNNTNQLFVIGALSGIIVLVLLYSAIKKFI